MSKDQDFEYNDKSRSQKKRESTAMQERGKELADLSPATQRNLPLSPELAEALVEWRSLKSHEARRRHMQYIGRLMREMDNPESLTAALDDLQNNRRQDAGQFKHLEQLRDSLLSVDEGERATAMTEAMGEYPALESSRLRHLIDAALADREKKRPPKHARELFRLLRQAEDAKA